MTKRPGPRRPSPPGLSVVEQQAAGTSKQSAGTFVMPAEWEPHRATWIAWPHQSRDWPGRFAPIPWCFAEIVRALTRGEVVAILVAEAAMERRVRRMPAAYSVVSAWPASALVGCR